MKSLEAEIEKRRNRFTQGLERESINYGFEETTLKSSGNLWRDLDNRYTNEKQLLVQWLQVRYGVFS